MALGPVILPRLSAVASTFAGLGTGTVSCVPVIVTVAVVVLMVSVAVVPPVLLPGEILFSYGQIALCPLSEGKIGNFILEF